MGLRRSSKSSQCSWRYGEKARKRKQRERKIWIKRNRYREKDLAFSHKHSYFLSILTCVVESCIVGSIGTRRLSLYYFICTSLSFLKRKTANTCYTEKFWSRKNGFEIIYNNAFLAMFLASRVSQEPSVLQQSTIYILNVTSLSTLAGRSAIGVL